MIDYAAILTRRFRDREWKLEGDDYAGLTFLDSKPHLSQKQLDDLWPSVLAEIKNEVDERAAAKTSALNKLKALGLTDSEIAALVG